LLLVPGDEMLIPAESYMERAVPVLPVDDLARAKRFYVDGLGFEVTFEVCEDDGFFVMGPVAATGT
jgi:catechol 2,3-dioxygenase-like lactoylglutathione lyase family enzyme